MTEQIWREQAYGSREPWIINLYDAMAAEIRRLRAELKLIDENNPGAMELRRRLGLPVETSSVQAPIARLKINDDGEISSVSQYAPGLPPGEHDLYCAPYQLSASEEGSFTETFRRSPRRVEEKTPATLSNFVRAGGAERERIGASIAKNVDETQQAVLERTEKTNERCRHGSTYGACKEGCPPWRVPDYTKRDEVMNPPQSAAEGCEAGNLTMSQCHGTGAVPRTAEARPAEAVPPPSIGDPCPNEMSA